MRQAIFKTRATRPDQNVLVSLTVYLSATLIVYTQTTGIAFKFLSAVSAHRASVPERSTYI